MGVLFEDKFSNLTRWNGGSIGASYFANLVTDPLGSGNNVLIFTSTTSSGNMYTDWIVSQSKYFQICAKVLALPIDATPNVKDVGGMIGVYGPYNFGNVGNNWILSSAAYYGANNN